jgi:hypothetical protein
MRRGRYGSWRRSRTYAILVRNWTDETVMEFAFPKEERAALVAGEPHKFSLPLERDLRFNWVHAELAALDATEARELVVDAWRMVVPQKVARAYDLTHPDGPS